MAVSTVEVDWIAQCDWAAAKIHTAGHDTLRKAHGEYLAINFREPDIAQTALRWPYAECFGGVMSAEQEIHSKFVGSHRRPMRRFPRDKRVDPLPGDRVNFRTGAAGNDPDCPGFLGTKHESFYWTTQCLSQLAIKFFAQPRSARLEPNHLTLFFEERLVRLKSERPCELCVVANLRMEIEWQMRTVKRDVVFERDA